MYKLKHKVLIIDDELKIQENLLRYFEDYDGFDVMGVDSSESALKVLPGGGIDLCIVELRLPGKNGLEFIARAKQDGFCEHFIIHTAFSGFGLAEELSRFNIPRENLFWKPCDTRALHDRIIEVLTTQPNQPVDCAQSLEGGHGDIGMGVRGRRFRVKTRGNT